MIDLKIVLSVYELIFTRMAFEILIQALTTFWSEYATSNLFIETFIKEKATCWYHTGHDSNSELHHSKNYSVTAYDQSGLIKHATQKINFTQTKKINFNIYIKNII